MQHWNVANPHQNSAISIFNYQAKKERGRKVRLGEAHGHHRRDRWCKG